MNLGRNFILDRDEVQALVKNEVAVKNTSPTVVVQFGIVVPYFIPFADKRQLSFSIDDNAGLVMVHSRVDMPATYNDGATNAYPLLGNSFLSRFEMIYLGVQGSDNTEQLLDRVVDVVVEKLNALVRSYAAVVYIRDAYGFSREMLNPHTFYKLYSYPSWDVPQSEALYKIHESIPLQRSISPELLDSVVALAESGGPQSVFSLSYDLMAMAHNYLRSGRYREAIIQMQTGVETFMRALYRELKLASGSPPLTNLAYSDVFKFHLPRTLGLSLDINNPGKAMDWHSHCYLKRNNVVHGGHDATRTEAKLALEVATDLIKYMRDHARANSMLVAQWNADKRE